MRQYLVVIVGILVVVVGMIAKSTINKQAPPAAGSVEKVLRAGEALHEALAAARPGDVASVEPRFATLACECLALGAGATAATKTVCERADVLRAAVKAGTSTPEGARELTQAVEALAKEVGPAK